MASYGSNLTRWAAFAALAAGGLAGIGCAGPHMAPPPGGALHAPSAAAGALSEPVLQPGDEVDLQIYREPEMSGLFRIMPEGTIRHPLAGAMEVSGQTIQEAEANIAKRLAKDYLVEPRVILKLVSAQSSQIVLLGEVKTPGVYPLPPGDSMTLLQAIAGAGGFTELASPDRVLIVRKTTDGRQTTIRVRAASLLKGRGKQRDIPLEPNDVITVPQVVF
jgi:protein involved in polysaccharide export with SLBB domain